MFTICIFITGSAVNFQGAFKNEASLKAARENIQSRRKSFLDQGSDGFITMKDDFGHSYDFIASQISVVLCQDNVQAHECAIEGKIDEATANLAFQERRSNDLHLMKLFPDPRMSSLTRAGNA